MISVSVWKLLEVIPTCRPSKGPASQPGQPPLRAGTYCVGLLAAPAASRKALVNTPSRPSMPSARRARVELDDPCSSAAVLLDEDRIGRPLPVRGVVACTRSLLRLCIWVHGIY
jgi:hypothetical protein